MAPGAKRKSLDHALASFPAPASGTRTDLPMIRKAFRKMVTVRVEGYLGAAARPRREEEGAEEVRVMGRVKWRRERGGGVARRRLRAGGRGAWRATPPSPRSETERVRGLEFGLQDRGRFREGSISKHQRIGQLGKCAFSWVGIRKCKCLLFINIITIFFICSYTVCAVSLFGA
jgi:hypothetical protein